MVSGGGRLRPQEDSLNGAIDMVVGTPGRILQHIQDGNIVYGDIKYVVSVLFFLPSSFCIVRVLVELVNSDAEKGSHSSLRR